MSKAIVEPTGDKVCPICGKGFYVQWPKAWVYKRGGSWPKYMCSWKCLQAYDNSKGVKKVGGAKKIVTDENRREAVRIVLAGGNPMEYLESLGVKAPDVMWYDIKKRLKDSDPETAAKLPAKLPPRDRTPKVETPEIPEVHTIEDAAKIVDNYFGSDTPEEPKIRKPVIYDGMVIREVESLFGRLRRSDVHGSIYLDFEPTDFADVLSYTVEQWRSFISDLKDCAVILGVEL